MPGVRRRARKLRSNAIALKPIVARTTPKTSERDSEEERIAAAEEARFARSEFWRQRRPSL
jgi:hypothetical protein